MGSCVGVERPPKPGGRGRPDCAAGVGWGLARGATGRPHPPDHLPGVEPGEDTVRVWPGTPYPLGATWDGEGVNFAIFSELATGVKLCLFDLPDDAKPTVEIDLHERTDLIWHCYLPDIRPGQLYGY